ncbi:DNA internalization-related competence protein ComEC/Rec2 [Paenibacillus yanchengensis]|uniref:DNA internalization-related competence protein ComEC/Rec2 n=1 Tax=Paenibacillus yanchengensis TaxID=2035833 RepID=A0ABW4YKI1_9BACL
MMTAPTKRPIVWITVAFIVGKLLVDYSSNRLGLLLLIGVWCLMLALLTYTQMCTRFFAIVMVAVLGISVGYNMVLQSQHYSKILQSLQWDGQQGQQIEHYDSIPVTIKGIVVSAAVVDGDRISLHMLSEEVQLHNDEQREKQLFVKEKVLVHLSLHEQKEQLLHRQMLRGTALQLTGTLHIPKRADNRDGFDYQQFLQEKNIFWLFKVASMTDVIWLKQQKTMAQYMTNAIDRLRLYLADHLDKIYSGSNIGFMKGLLLGIREDFDERQFQQFSQVGITHILAISGLHVAVFMYMVTIILKFFRFTRERINGTLLSLIPLYVVLSGASPSVIRAGMMALLALFAIQAGKQKNTIHIIAATALIMLLYKPAYLYDVSFQLSFIVTSGLIIGVPALRNYFPQKKMQRFIFDIFTVSLVAQLISFPLTIYYFNQFHLLSLLANVLFVPMISSIILPLAMISLIVSLFSISIASWLAKMITGLNQYVLNGIEWFAKQTSFLTIWGTPPVWWVGTWLVVSFLLFIQLRTKNEAYYTLDEHHRFYMFSFYRMLNYVRRPFMLSMSLLILLVYSYNYPLLYGVTEISFLAVGQGDATLIRSSNGKVILIDGGGTLSFGTSKEQWKARKRPFEVGKQVVVPLLKKRGIKQIDMLIISHLDTDHIGGLLAVLEHIPVKEVWWNQTLKKSSDTIQLMEMIIAKKIPLYSAVAGENYQVANNIQMQFLWPDESAVRRNTVEYVEDQNEWSVVLLLDIEGKRILLTGDIGQTTEQRIIQLLHKLMLDYSGQIDVMKVAHHGSKHSMGDEWLAYWQPRAAVISVGERNSYGHPHSDVLDRLDIYGVDVYQTSVNGEVVFRIKKQMMYVYTKRSSIYETN